MRRLAAFVLPEMVWSWSNKRKQRNSAYLVGRLSDGDVAVKDEADPSEQIRDTHGDELDYIFSPLDGTTMYSIFCKMNDSACLVQTLRLTAYCVARRDVVTGEELTISYIYAEVPYAKRQEILQSCGFTCKCSKYERDSSTKDGTASLRNEDQKNALFGADDEDEMFGADDDQDNKDLGNE
jgi:hypothetical protein